MSSNPPDTAAARASRERERKPQSVAVGRIVQYREQENGPPRAALVVADAGSGKANLVVFSPSNGEQTFVRAAEQGKGARQFVVYGAADDD